MVRNKKNHLWMYYDIIGLNEATCKLCQKTIKTSGNTSNMLKHLRLRHPNFTGDENSIKSFISAEQTRVKQVKMEFPKEEFIDSSQGGSTATDCEIDATDIIEFAPVAENETNSGDGVLIETDDLTDAEQDVADTENDATCVYELEMDVNNTYLKPSEQQTPNLYTTAQRYQLPRQLLQFICIDKQPLDIVESAGFQKFFTALCPLYKLPSRLDLKTELEKCYEQQLHKAREKLASLQSISLSCNIWQHKNKGCNYLDITAHYIEGVQVRRRFLATSVLYDDYNATQVVQLLKRACCRFNIQKERIACVVSESHTVLSAAMRDFVGSERHVHCFARTLKVLLDSIFALDCLKSLLSKLRAIVKFFQVNAYYADLLCSEQLQQPLPLILDNSWNSISCYYMIERYIQLSAMVQNVIRGQTRKIGPAPLIKTEVEALKEILKILKPFESILSDMCATAYISLSKVLPIMCTLNLDFEQLKSKLQNKLATQVLHFVINKLTPLVNKFEANPLIANACMLDPRFKNIPFHDTDLASKYITELCELHKEYQFPANSNANAAYDFWAGFRNLAHAQNKRKLCANVSLDDDDEVIVYFSSDVSVLQTEALTQWNDMRNLHPFLYSKACESLHIPATALNAACYFTDSGMTECAARQRLDAMQLDQMYFLSDCNSQEWQL